MQIFAVSDVSDSSYCNRNANSGIETDETKEIFIWEPVTKETMLLCLVCLLQMINSCGLHIEQW